MSTITTQVIDCATANNSLETFSPLYHHPSDSSGTQLVNSIFYEKGYAGWSRALVIALSAKNKLSLIDGTLSEPAVSTARHKLWSRLIGFPPDFKFTKSQQMASNNAGSPTHKQYKNPISINYITSHSYCKNCIAKYISSKLQENISRISCPVTACNGELEPQSCGSILPYDVFVKWGDALCESMILVSEKFYCPFKDCSALLIDECAGENMVIDQSECPECRKLFCAKCKVPWHSGFVCEEFDKLNNDEREVEGLQLMKLAKSQGWQRCPSCMMYVEKSEGVDVNFVTTVQLTQMDISETS
ncbi:hypothetical protein T459_34230 [Capsicum annuum]|uniref:RBR-type E3 ubiquitin transferase n=1 Tax=Capsicum annuum TaxID=4072 RepID=A0A2G2XWN4_CAPAN|nr:hypothetical protein T459_34230 [Capsicum annuum]